MGKGKRESGRLPAEVFDVPEKAPTLGAIVATLPPPIVVPPLRLVSYALQDTARGAIVWEVVTEGETVVSRKQVDAPNAKQVGLDTIRKLLARPPRGGA